jgi:hypothetical protein
VSGEASKYLIKSGLTVNLLPLSLVSSIMKELPHTIHRRVPPSRESPSLWRITVFLFLMVSGFPEKIPDLKVATRIYRR